MAVGEAVDAAWEGRLVFAFQPHQSHFTAQPEELIPVPAISPGRRRFPAKYGNRVNFILDGAPRVGERALVFGQGIVGLLTAALLAQFPLERLVTLDRYPPRRQASLEAGAQVCLDPGDTGTAEQLHPCCPRAPT